MASTDRFDAIVIGSGVSGGFAGAQKHGGGGDEHDAGEAQEQDVGVGPPVEF